MAVNAHCTASVSNWQLLVYTEAMNRPLHYLLWVLACCYLPSVSAQTEPPAAATSTRFAPPSSLQLLADTLQQQAIWLPENEPRYLTAWLGTTADNNKGCLIIVAEYQQLPTDPAWLDPVRHYLVDQRWSNLTLYLPDADMDFQEWTDLLQAADNWVRQQRDCKPAFLSVGFSSAAVVEYLITSQPQWSGLAMLDARFSDPAAARTNLSQQTLPIMELHSGYGGQSGQWLLSRQNNNASDYRQLRLPPLTAVSNSDQRQLAKHLRGWLQKLDQANTPATTNQPPANR